MRSSFRVLFLGMLVLLVAVGCKKTVKTQTETVDTYVADNYTKKEVDIEMRDGVKLHTTIYSPKDTSKKYPIIM